MDFQYNVSRNYNRINFQNIFGMQFLPSALKEIYDAVVKRSYKDLILDFSGLEAAFADGMVPLCSYVRYIKEEYNVSIEYVAPNSLRLNRIFVNANWAHLIDSTARESKYSGYKQFPATIVNDDDDLSSVVNSVLDCVLRATDLKCREDLGVIEWVINEIAENILRHSESTVGGLVHLSRFIQNKKCIEIVFSDSGIGIAESLKSVPKYSTASDCELLERVWKLIYQ